MAIRKELGNRVLIAAGKAYTLTESIKDITGTESEGVEKIVSETTQEALSVVREGERVVSVNSGFISKNMTTHFWVLVIAERSNEKAVDTAISSVGRNDREGV